MQDPTLVGSNATANHCAIAHITLFVFRVFGIIGGWGIFEWSLRNLKKLDSHPNGCIVFPCIDIKALVPILFTSGHGELLQSWEEVAMVRLNPVLACVCVPRLRVDDFRLKESIRPSSNGAVVSPIRM